MNLQQLLAAGEKEFDEKFDMKIDNYQVDVIKAFMRDFALRIVEECERVVVPERQNTECKCGNCDDLKGENKRWNDCREHVLQAFKEFRGEISSNKE